MGRPATIAVAMAAAMLATAGQGRAVDDGKAMRSAAADAGRAERALKRDRTADAVALAEQAVMRSPRTARYRMLLGRAYLAAGRFAAAAQAFGEVVALGGRGVALKLALAQVATGDRAGALATLSADQGISVADRGLALALAGEPAAAVALLLTAAREPGADARLRQNLALTYALAGEWTSARIVAATDLPPAEVDRRMQQWAAFARPRAASDQVAALLGVTAVADPGQPAVLALVAPAAPVPASAAVVSVAVAPVAVTTPATPIRFGPRQEVVQALPGSTDARRWHVQLGAFPDLATARAAWTGFTRREPAIAVDRAQGMAIRARAGMLIRLSVGGLTLNEAERLCRRHRSRGGRCFVRPASGDRALAWDGDPAGNRTQTEAIVG